MDELLRTSLLWRLFAALAALYHRTFLPRMFAAIHRAFAESLPGRTLRRLFGGFLLLTGLRELFFRQQRDKNAR